MLSRATVEQPHRPNHVLWRTIVANPGGMLAVVAAYLDCRPVLWGKPFQGATQARKKNSHRQICYKFFVVQSLCKYYPIVQHLVCSVIRHTKVLQEGMQSCVHDRGSNKTCHEMSIYWSDDYTMLCWLTSVRPGSSNQLFSIEPNPKSERKQSFFVAIYSFSSPRSLYPTKIGLLKDARLLTSTSTTLDVRVTWHALTFKPAGLQRMKRTRRKVCTQQPFLSSKRRFRARRLWTQQLARCKKIIR